MNSIKMSSLADLPLLPKLKLAVVGHVEWVNFLALDKLPQAGIIGHANNSFEAPAGGGAVIAVKMAEILKQPVHFITALGNDELGEKSHQRLKELGLVMHVAWKNKPTRRGISMVDQHGERAITVVGERLTPTSNDELPWNELGDFDGIFVTATDAKGLQFCRKARLIAATPRIGIDILQKSNVHLNALIGSGLDPGETIDPKNLKKEPEFQIATLGAKGGKILPNKYFEAVNLSSPMVDTYGCGDTFAAGVTTGLAANWSLNHAITLGAHMGAKCTTYFGPY